MVEVRFLSLVAEHTGTLRYTLKVGGATTVRGLIDALDELFPGIKRLLLDDNGNLKRNYDVFVNGRSVDWLNGLDTVVSDDDVVTITFLAIFGG